MWGNEAEETEVQEVQQEAGSDLLKPINTLNAIDQRFNSLYNGIIGNINSYNLHTSKMQTIAVQEISKSLSKKVVEETNESEQEKTEEEVKKLLNADGNDILGNNDEFAVPAERKKRYEFYNEIPNVNYIAHRMLKVYLDNILIKNVQTKQFLNITENQNNSLFLKSIQGDIGKHYDNLMKTCSIFFDLQNKLKNKIIPNMLKYGNSFMEVLNLKDIATVVNKTGLIMEGTDAPEIPSDNTLILESITDAFIDGDKYKKKTPGIDYCSFEYEHIEENDSSIVPVKAATATEQFQNLLRGTKGLLEENNSYWTDIQGDKEGEFKFNDINELDFQEMKHIFIKDINPNQVIIVEQDGFLYGYLVVEELESNNATEVDVLKRFTQQEGAGNNQSEDMIRKSVIEKMTTGILKKLNNVLTLRNTDLGNLEGLNLGEDIEDSIKVILYHKLKDKSQLKFRFVAPNKMVNFSTNIDKFGPYGTSIFDPIIQPVKMYTLALMSSIVSRLSRASVVRKWTIEAGNKKNHAEIIEKVKKDINNKSITFDSLSNIKNIAQNITDFRDIATIQVNGQRFIDMEVMPMGDRSLPLNDMQELRNELIAATGVPSVYLNVGDQVDLRETLVSLNTSFATTISSYQSNIDDAVNHLMNIIFDIVLENNDRDTEGFILSNYYKFNLNPPLILTVQSNEALISSVSNIIGMLKSAEVVIDPEEILKLYIPQMNWEQLLKSGNTFIKKQAKEQLIAQTEGDETQGM